MARKPRKPTAAELLRSRAKTGQLIAQDRKTASERKTRRPRRPTAREQATIRSRTRTQRIRHEVQRKTPDLQSEAAVERYMTSPRYAEALTRASLAKEVQERKARLAKRPDYRPKALGLVPVPFTEKPRQVFARSDRRRPDLARRAKVDVYGRARLETKGKSLTELAELADMLRKAEKSKNPTKVAADFAKDKGTLEAQQAATGVQAAGQKLLDYSIRPTYASAGATSAALRGKGPKEIAKAAKRGIQGKEKKTYSDVLNEQGIGGPVASVAGFALDIGLDPTTYVTFGAGSVARQAAQKSAQRAAKAAERAALKSATTHRTAIEAARKTQREALEGGATAEQARKLSQRAYRDTRKAVAAERGRAAGQAALRRAEREADLKAPRRRRATGIEARFAGRRLPGVTRATGNVRHAARVAGAPITDSGPGQLARKIVRGAGSELHAGVRSFGQSKAEQQTIKALQREARAEGEGVTRRINLRVRNTLRGLDTDQRRQVIDALEANDLRGLDGQLHQIARRVQDDLKYLRRVGRRSGLILGDIGPQSRTRLEGIHAAPSAGIRSETKVQRALDEARAEWAAARTVLKTAAPAQRVAARRRVTAAQQRVQNLRARRDAIRRRKADARTAQAVRDASRAQRAQTEAQGYFPRVRSAELEQRSILAELAEPDQIPVARLEQIGANAPQIGAGQRRAYRQSRAELRKTDKGRAKVEPLSDDIRGSVAAYGTSVGKGAAARNLNLKILQSFGERLPRNISEAQLIELHNRGKHVYRVRRGVLERLDEGDFALINRASKTPAGVRPGAALPGGGQYAIFDDAVLARARKQGTDLGARFTAVRALIDTPQRGYRHLALATLGYPIRNLAGDLFNAWGDEKATRLLRNSLRSGSALNALGRYEQALQKFARELPDAKRRAFTLSDEQARQVARALDIPVAKLDARMGPEKAAVLAERLGVIRQGRLVELTGESRKLADPGRRGPWRRMLQRVEDQTRLATFLGGLQRGMSPRDAAHRASQIHFDYNDLTTLEKTVGRRLGLFYTFPSRNIPLQAKRLATRPGRTATVAKALEEGRKATGLPEDFREGQDPYEARQLGLPIRWGEKTYTLSMGLPYTDLNDITDFGTKLGRGNVLGAADVALQRVAEMASPLVKAPLELKANYSFFYRDRIDRDDKLTRAPRWAIELGKRDPQARKWLQLDPNYAPREGGKAWGWPRKIDYGFRQAQPGAVAALIDVLGLGVKGKNAREMSEVQRQLARAGVRAIAYEHNQAELNRLYDESERVDARMRRLRSTYVPGTRVRVDAAHPTPEYTRLMRRQRVIEARKRALEGEQPLGRTGTPAGLLTPPSRGPVIRGGGPLTPERSPLLIR